MTQFQHNIVAGIILIILWHLCLKRYFITEKNLNDWEELFDSIKNR